MVLPVVAARVPVSSICVNTCPSVDTPTSSTLAIFPGAMLTDWSASSLKMLT